VAEVGLDAAAGLVPHHEVLIGIDRRLALDVGNGQAAARGHGAEVDTDALHGARHGFTDAAEVLEIRA
jgi:hypothetical protein